MASNSNSMVDRQLSHRTIREFTDQPVDDQILATIYEVAMRTKAFVEAFTDASLMAQNVVNAAESFGLGANYLGNIHNDTAGVIELLRSAQCQSAGG